MPNDHPDGPHPRRARLDASFRATTLVLAAALAPAGCRHTAAPLPTQPPPPVTVAQPIEREISDFLELTGRTEAAESVDIHARVSGFLVSVSFVPGRIVKQGDLLFEIDPRPYQAEVDRAAAEVARTEAGARQADIEFRRLEDLFKRGSAGKVEFERNAAAKAKSDAEVLAAKAALDRAKLDLEWTRIVAPRGGEISRNYVDVGNLVVGGAGGATLLSNIRSVDPIRCYFDIDERSMLQIQKSMRENNVRDHSQGARASVFMGLAIDEGYPHAGVVDFVDNTVDVNTGTLRLRAVFPNPEKILQPGLFARIRIPISASRRALLIAERALGTDQGQRFVLVVGADNTAQYRSVKIGRFEGGLREVIDGVQATDWVIVNGIRRARPGAPVQPSRSTMPSDHETPGTSGAKSPATPPASQPSFAVTGTRPSAR